MIFLWLLMFIMKNLYKLRAMPLLSSVCLIVGCWVGIAYALILYGVGLTRLDYSFLMNWAITINR